MGRSFEQDNVEGECLKIFLQSAQEMLNELHEKVVLLESCRENRDFIDIIFRLFHTLKGNASFLGIVAVQNIAHALEDLLADCQLRQGSIDNVFFDIIWEGIGLLGKNIDSVKVGNIPVEESQEEKALIARVKKKVTDDAATFKIVEPGKDSPQAQKQDSNQPMVNKESSYRIEENKINELCSSVDKLGKIGAAFYQLEDKLLEPNIPTEYRLELKRAIGNLTCLCQDISGLLVGIKLVSPVTFMENSKSLIVALAQSYHKKVRVEMQCRDMLIERINLEVLENVFIHLVRNCIGHGIEFPDERTHLGKPEEGLIKIDLLDDQEKLVIRISDDGRGVDFKALREAAYADNKITKDELEHLSDDESAKLIFLSGVSTSKSITDISGRGMGMDVVLRIIQKYAGEIVVKSQLGKGTVIELKLPKSHRPSVPS
ncbi:MAG: ATP-binding protein [Candidatus Omnitrophota bacterium]|jgi:two-component system chemotaxis sensor kinase CheA